jgi:glycosyltransferase involved in cell wall biosynthesis
MEGQTKTVKTVSFIVPVYNTGKYLSECVDSIIAQTYADIEIVLVDDGSTDGSGGLCDEYTKKDARIKVIHKENGGLSSARNTGMDIAFGEYIAFVDSDDTLKVEFAEKTVKALEGVLKEKNTGICFSFCDCETSRCTLDVSRFKGKECMTEDEFIAGLEDPVSRDYLLGVMACNKLYYRPSLQNLRFPEGRLHEDEFFINDVMGNMERCAFVAEKLYIYRDNDEGITGRKNSLDPRHLDVIDAYGKRAKLFLEMSKKAPAESVVRNGLYRLCRMYLDAAGDKTVQVKILKKYREFYKEHAGCMNGKKRLKYALFLVHPVFSKLICR